MSSQLRAVLFDWRRTLVHDPPDEWWIARALDALGRATDDAAVATLCEGLRTAARLAEVVDGERTCDCSAAAHRDWSMMYFRLAGLDDDLCESLYALDFDAMCHPFYPDAAPVLRALRDRGCRIALVSDIHVDLRSEIVAADLYDCFDAFVLSFEQGVQKPQPEIFEIALRALDVHPAETLMVGDRASHDGGAVALGITTLLLPEVASADVPVGLHRVLALLD
jgi:HAD superfamily hydrolase (TIGR01509 family)